MNNMVEIEQKVVQQEAAALNPENEGSNPSLHPKFFCMICGKQIPEKRARQQLRRYLAPPATCSEPCKDKLDYQREQVIKFRKCRFCLHPSTPQEQEEFRAWRTSRGDVKDATPVNRGQYRAAKAALVEALREAVGVLTEELRVILDSNCTKTPEGRPDRTTITPESSPYAEKLEEKIGRFQKLVDKYGVE